MVEDTKMSKEEQIGFHKGSLNTLIKEREELIKMATVVAQLINLHIKALKDLGIDLNETAQEEKSAPKNLEEV